MVLFADWLPVTNISLPLANLTSPAPENLIGSQVFFTPKQMRRKEIQKKSLLSQPMISLRSCWEEILVLLSSYHTTPYTTIILGFIKTFSKRKEEMWKVFSNWLCRRSLSILQIQLYHSSHPPHLLLEVIAGSLYSCDRTPHVLSNVTQDVSLHQHSSVFCLSPATVLFHCHVCLHNTLTSQCIFWHKSQGFFSPKKCNTILISNYPIFTVSNGYSLDTEEVRKLAVVYVHIPGRWGSAKSFVWKWLGWCKWIRLSILQGQPWIHFILEKK